ncbi:alpha/beta fold hydrolase [Paraburkholderia graminis]|uniref:epoxide hydrolase family protein n=1 Tax=Paraburkholderia graminis TaxID=60548 RepID=UPI00389A7F7D
MSQDTPQSSSRRHFVGVAAAALAAGSLSRLAFADTSPAIGRITEPANGDKSAIRPFRVQVPEAQLVDMRRRIKATRWPDRETVPDESQGIQLAMIQTLAQYWSTGYDWRKCEARLNSYPQFITEIDGLDIHFLHVRSKHENAMPLIVTHGWPGSVIEQFKIIDPLVNPTAYGAPPSDAFHLVIPSLPGYGFSARPTTTGWGPERTARAWVTLMKRLGYERFASQGGDLGGIVTNIMAKQAPPELIGIHVNFPAAVPAEILKSLAAGDPIPQGLSDEEKHAYDQLSANFKKKRGYAVEMGTRPQTLYGLADSPVALASWLLDHGDGYGQPAAALSAAVLGHPVNGHSAGALTRDDILDDITLYWITNTGVSASRFYWESHANFFLAADVNVPAAVSAFPGENYQAPKSWTEKAYHNLMYFNKPETGGHFAAWEEPIIFANEVRAGLRPLRA